MNKELKEKIVASMKALVVEIEASVGSVESLAVNIGDRNINVNVRVSVEDTITFSRNFA